MSARLAEAAFAPDSRAFRFPCTGSVPTRGFGAFLEANLGDPRANLRAFARELGARFGARRITLANSGSSANLAAALALAERVRSREGRRGARPPHAVVAGFTFPTTVSSLVAAGFEVSVADTLPGGFVLDPAALRRALRPRTRLVAVTHFLGFPAPLAAIGKIARERGLLVLQDACESMDLRVEGRPAHAHGTVTTWSFYHPHHLSSFGGGAAIANDARTQRLLESITHWGRACTCHVEGVPCRAERARGARPFGIDHHFQYVRAGHNLEMSELNACFGRWQLASWERIEVARTRRYDVLFRTLEGVDGVRALPRPVDTGSPFAFAFTLAGGRRRRADVAARLAARGVETRTLMGGEITGQRAWRHLPHDGLENARRIAAASLLVGIHQTLPLEDVRSVARILREELAR